MVDAKGFVDFNSVKEQVPITEVLKRYGLLESLEPTGRQLAGPCPVHQGDGSAFKVDPQMGTWYCFSCEEGGDAIALVARLEGVGVRDAALKMVAWFNLNPETRNPPDRTETIDAGKSPPGTAGTGNPPLPFKLDLDPEHPWFERNAITSDAIAHFGLGYCASSRVIGSRIGIPIHNAVGDLVAYAGLAHQHNQKPRVAFPERFSRDLELYNFHRALTSGEQGLVIVPDCVEVWRLHQDGKRNVVGVMGWQLSGEQLALLKSHYPAGKTAVKVRWPAEHLDPLPIIIDQLAGVFFVHYELFER